MCEFCKNILHNLDLLGAGECSLKGFIAHKLHTIQNKIKELQVVKNENVDLVRFFFSICLPNFIIDLLKTDYFDNRQMLSLTALGTIMTCYGKLL